MPGWDKVRLHLLPPPGLMEGVFARRALGALRELIERVEVVHLHGVWDPILPKAANEARRQRKPYIVLLNGMLDPWSLAQKAIKKSIALTLRYRRMLNGAAALHVGNRGEQEAIAPLNLKSPTAIIPNGVFFEELEPVPPKGSFYAEHPELAGRPFVLFLGRIHYKKGLDYLADAFALVAREHPRAALVVTGPDDGEEAPFRRRVAALGLGDRVVVTGPLYGHQKLAAYVDARCYCLPSRQEGFSLAVVEAMACGLPAVISEPCHFPEMAAAGAGFVTPLEAPRIARCLSRLLGDPTQAARMGRAGRELIAAQYTWPLLARRTMEAYRAAVAGRPVRLSPTLAGVAGRINVTSCAD